MNRLLPMALMLGGLAVWPQYAAAQAADGSDKAQITHQRWLENRGIGMVAGAQSYTSTFNKTCSLVPQIER